MTDFTTRGRIPKQQIDTLLDALGSDEWLFAALMGPLRLAIASTVIVMAAWIAHGYFLFFRGTATPGVVFGPVLVWPAILAYAALEMRRLRLLRHRTK